MSHTFKKFAGPADSIVGESGLSDCERSEVLEGLLAPEKFLNPKFFYDEAGSKLFDQICELPEYYQTRTEAQILSHSIKEIASSVGPGSQLIELGSGSSTKTRILLQGLEALEAYVPIDICKAQLMEASQALRAQFANLRIEPVCADYTQNFEFPASLPKNSRRICFFPGSTIGNLEPIAALRLLSRIKRITGRRGALIIGVDLKKEFDVLNRAYNDARGVTSEFNLNVLRRINREMNADFDLNSFKHHAFYNPRKGRIEMHLVSLRAQSVKIDGQILLFREGETIHTENSYKYSVDDFRNLARSAGYSPLHAWTDERSLFSVHYLRGE